MSAIDKQMELMTQMVAMMQQQIQNQEQQRKDDKEMMQQQKEEEERRFKQLLTMVKPENPSSGTNATTTSTVVASSPKFSPFDSTSELWIDYYARFTTFLAAHSIPTEKRPQVFLTNQTSTVYKLLSNLADQAEPPKNINDLTLDEIVNFMKDQYDPKEICYS